jgi:signal transduction histidine kinase
VLAEVVAGLDNTLAVAALLAAGQARREDTDVDTMLAIVLADIPANDRERVRIDRVSRTRTAAMDLGLMRLAMRNLVANALAYAPGGTPVRVCVLDGDAPLSLIFDVRNAGPAIPPGLVPRLFERGTSGRRRAGVPSSGLGLYIVRRVMELHRGEVRLVDNDDDAVTFRLVVPQDLDA